jgi:hypothetical protein
MDNDRDIKFDLVKPKIIKLVFVASPLSMQPNKKKKKRRRRRRRMEQKQ